MTPIRLACAVVVVLAAAPAAAQTPGDTTGRPVVYAGVFSASRSGGGGSAAITAREPSETMLGAVYLAPCGSLGTSSHLQVSQAATDVWQLSGQVLALNAEGASVRLTWQRVRAAGQDVTEPPRAGEFTLRLGERAPLDSVVVPAAGQCPERSASLELRFEMRDEVRGPGGARVVWPFIARGGGPGVGGGGGIGRGPTSSGSAGGIANIPTTGGGGGGRSGASSFYHADLWLIHSAPNRPDEVLHTTAAVWSMPRPFAFAPVTIHTPDAVVTVKVNGSVEVGHTPEGEPTFYFSANRAVTFAPLNRPARDVAPSVEGTTKTSVAIPGPDDVLAFEMPALRIPGGPALPDGFSVRVRLTPVAARPAAGAGR